MAQISYGVSTELDAVNSILMSVGETPVNTLTVQSPEVAIAQKTLRQVCREIQAEGWSYNTENEYPIELDTNNQCIVPNNVLQMDLNIFQHGKDYNVVDVVTTVYQRFMTKKVIPLLLKIVINYILI